MQKQAGPLRTASRWLITFLVATAILLVLVLTNVAPTMTPTLKIMLVISLSLLVGLGATVFFRAGPKTNKRDVKP
jgi:ABC-type nickel/cobalt efflux system permease component RcnA